jgi:hypothetical protein
LGRAGDAVQSELLQLAIILNTPDGVTINTPVPGALLLF